MMNPFSNPSYLLPPLLVVFVTILLLVLVWQRSRSDFSSRIFCCLLLSVGLWALFVFGMRSSPDTHQAVLWARLIVPTAFAIFVFYYHFSLAHTGTRGQRGILFVSYLFLVIAAGLISTRLLVDRMVLQDYGYAPVMGTVGLPLVIGAMLLVGGGTYNLLRRYKVSHSYEERNRLLYLVIASAFPLLGGVLDAFSNLPPAAIWSNLIFCILCSIAIVKYHLLDIRIVARKSLVYLFVSLVIAVPYVSILALLNHILRARMEPWWVHAIIILLLAILLRPLYSWAQNFMDRLFYRDRYDYLKALQQFSQKAQSVINLKELSSTLTQLVSGALHTSSVCLLLPSESDNGLVVVSSAGLSSPPPGVVLRNRSPLTKWLKLKQCILSSEEFDIVPQLQSLSLREKKNLEQMEAKLYVPIQPAPGQISGILVLGQKLSRQPYSNEEKRLLTTLSSQMAIALENARLYNESQQELRERKQVEEREKELQQELYESGRLAAIGELAAGVAHEINNPLTAILGFSQRILRKNHDESLTQDLERISGEALRAAKIVQNLLTFARRREPKKEDCDVNDILQMALELRAYELRTSNIEVVVDLTPNLPKVRADSHQIQEVFLNLVLNAEQIMVEAHQGGTLSIKICENKGYVQIIFTDNGPGIAKENLRRIFLPFFSTRADKGGTGLGLSICHGIMMEHGGKIHAKSRLGEGATFVIELPVAASKTRKGKAAK